MESGPLPTCGSRLRAAHARLKHLQELHGWRVGPCQNVALTVAPRTFVLNIRARFTGSHGQRTRHCV
eukprot:6478318-Pyramimonas_sp.AAC.1